MNDKLIDRLFQRFDVARNGYAGEGAYKEGLRAVLAELAKVDLGEALPDVETMATEMSRTCFERSSQRALDLVRSHVVPIIAALRAENDILREWISELEAKAANLRGEK